MHKIVVAILTIPIGVTSLLIQSASAASVGALEANQMPITVAQRYGDRWNDERRYGDEYRRGDSRREELQRAAQREEFRRNQQPDDRYYNRREPIRRAWIPGHYEPGFLGLGRKWVEGYWENRR